MKEVVNIKWVIAHDPLYLFIRAAGYFQEAVNKKSDKYEVRVEIMTPTDYATKYNNGFADPLPRDQRIGRNSSPTKIRNL